MMHIYKSFLVGILLMMNLTLMSQGHLAKSTTIPFELTSHNNLSVTGIFGGLDTLKLMFHTAANSVTLTSKAAANLQSILWSKQTEVSSWGGSASSRYSDHNVLAIADLQWDSLIVWEDENSGPFTDGKFGPNLFQGQVIELDFDQQLMVLHESLPKKSNQYMKLPILHRNDMLFIEGSISIDDTTYTNQFLIHTGYGGALLLDDQFTMDSKIGEKIEILDEKKLKDSFGNEITVNKGLMPALSLGSEELTNVPVGFFQGKIGRQQMSILGADLLKRFNVIIDSDREYIYLKANQLKEIDYTLF